jgi:modulator of FtsH protease
LLINESLDKEIIMNQTMTQPGVRSVEVNRVLKNTYILLSLTLAFSAFMSYVAVATGTGRLGSPFLVMGVYMGLFFVISKLRNSPLGILAVFALTGFLGWTLGPMISSVLTLSNGPQIVTLSLGGTAAIFFAMSGFALFSRRDFGFMGNFLLIGMLTVFVVSIVNYFFLQLPGLQMAISGLVILIFSGFILWDTSDIIHGRETNYIMATTGMYVSIYNIFANLLALLGVFGGDE